MIVYDAELAVKDPPLPRLAAVIVQVPGPSMVMKVPSLPQGPSVDKVTGFPEREAADTSR